MADPLQIRAARDTDRPGVVAFLAQLQAHEVALHDTRKPADHDLCAHYVSDFSARAADQGGAMLVTLVDGQLVGFICFWVEISASTLETEASNRCGYISDLFVAEDHRGQGVGQRLLDAAKAHFGKDPSVTRLRICTLANNALAVSAYERAGFKPYETTYEITLPGPRPKPS